MKLGTFLLDLLFPIRCVVCKREKTHCCMSCKEKLKLVPAISILRSAPEIRVHSFFTHLPNSPITELIHRFKYDSNRSAIVPIFETLRTSHCLQEKFVGLDAVYVPVPLHTRRKKSRNFNQSESIAAFFSRQTGHPVEPILIRHRATKAQAQLPRCARLTNVANAFSIAPTFRALSPNSIYILVDDVVTTGSTLRACAHTLRQNGARRVEAVVLAKA